MSDAASPAAAFRVILQVDGEDGPPETTLPFPPYRGLHLRSPVDGCFAEIAMVCWDDEESAFLVSFEE